MSVSWIAQRLVLACSVAAVAALMVGVAAAPAWATTTDCSGGGTFTITSNVVSAGDSCVGTATIPSTVTTIGQGAFLNATGLTSVTFQADSTVTMIDERAFENATGLTSIVIPSTVTSIRRRAFRDATGLTSVTFEGNAPTVGANAFTGVASGATANIGFAATGFEPVVAGLWQGLVLERAADPSDPVTGTSVPEAGPSVPEADTSSSARLTLTCSTDAGLAVGSLVTCTVAGGDAGIDILWRAAFNPTFAEAGVTLDGAGFGAFSFVVPAEALGEALTLELVEWAAPLVLGIAGGPVPGSVPTGEGPVPVWHFLLLMLPIGLALRTRPRSGWPALRVS
jgi:hypothetical protein